jgi:glycosyltransferase involved in cell wall biosynthesis
MRKRAAAAAARVLERIVGVAADPMIRRWQPHSRLFLVGERANWVIDREMAEVARIAALVGIAVGPPALATAVRGQCLFFGSQFVLLRPPRRAFENRLALAYFHGRPGTPGSPEFDECFDALRRRHEQLARVQVSHREIHNVVLASGIDPAKVFTIPIAVNTDVFTPVTDETRRAARVALGIPEGAFVVGSFQKDGVGWAEGREPKLVKGPDAFVETVGRVRERVPGIFVLLTGPARGYVKNGLERLGVPYRHVYAAEHAEMATMTHALDLYLIASRQEGGPKAFLESLACGIPVVSTRVGQVVDLGRNGENAWLANVDAVEGLAGLVEHVVQGGEDVRRVVAAGLVTAAENSYQAQLPLWREFFDGFVEGDS